MGRRARPPWPTPCSSPPAPSSRKGSVDDGTSSLDVDDEEKRRHFTIDCHLGHLAWDGKQIHLIDTPGYPDFIGSALSALAAVENVVVAVSGPSGIEVNTRRVFQEAGRLGLGRFVVVTKMDAENVDYRSDLAAIRETFGTQCVPFNVPVGQGPSFSGVIDVLKSHDENPAGCPLAPSEAYQMVVEQIVEIDEELMMRYLEGETIGPDELRKTAHDAIAAGQARPGPLRLHSQGPRPQGAARPDRDLRPLARRTSTASAPAATAPTRPRTRSCRPSRARWSPRCSRRSTISSWAS